MESQQPPPTGEPTLRNFAAQHYLAGDGIEIGALHVPLAVPPAARVRYVDRLPPDELRRQYPELEDRPLVEVDILDDGERLAKLQDGSQDFVIANHFVEHCENPILALTNMFRVLRPGGVLYMALPDMRYTFDRHREVTTIDHIVRDFQYGPAASREQHFEEFARCFGSDRTDEEVAHEVERLKKLDYSIHFHAWTQIEMLELLIVLRRGLNLAFEVELTAKNEIEFLMVLRKGRG
jgi:predicted SAM-dependent methyltransferase